MKFLKKGIQAFQNMPIQVKASMAFMIVNFMQKGISFITAPIFTRLLSTEEYGKVTVYLSWVDMIGIFAMFGLYNNVFYNGITEFKNDKKRFTSSMLILANIITLVTFVIVWTTNKYFFHFLNISDGLILFMFLTFLLEPAFEFWKIEQRFDFKYKMLCLFSVMVMIASPIFAIIGIRIFPDGKVAARIIGSQLMTLFICAGCYVFEIIRAKSKPVIAYWKYAITYNLPLIPYFLSSYVLSSSDRLMIAYYCGEDKAGIYGIAYTMASAVNIVWASINATMIPTIYKRCDENRRETLSEFVNPVIMAYMALCVLVMLLAPEVIAILAPASYGDGMYVIPSVVGGVFFTSLFNIFSDIIYYYKHPKSVMGAGVGASVVNFVLNMLFIPTVGYLAAGYTTLFAYLFEVLWAYAAMKKITHSSVFDIKGMALYGGLALTASIVLPLLYGYFVIRVILTICLLLFLWKNKDQILSIIWRK